MAVKQSENKGAAKQLKWYQLLLLRGCSLLVAVWTRTLRFHWGADVQALMDQSQPPSIAILWHNRLFVAPEFFRRYFRERKLAALISASDDGAWLAAFLQQLRILPVRGSHYNRGPQAVREMIAALKAGHDIAITPDGSRGPIYDMKPRTLAVAFKMNTPMVLLSYNFSKVWRLKSWDRFNLPVPFSRIEVKVDCVDEPATLGENPKDAAAVLKRRMDAITRDDEYLGQGGLNAEAPACRDLHGTDRQI